MNVLLDDFPAGPVQPQGGAGVRVDFHRRDMGEARLLQAKRLAARSRADLQAGQLMHDEASPSQTPHRRAPNVRSSDRTTTGPDPGAAAPGPARLYRAALPKPGTGATGHCARNVSSAYGATGQ